MAIFNSSTFGTISGRHGSAVATTTKNGKSILRIYRQSVDANTEKQQAQRTKFGYTMASLQCMREIFNQSLKAKGGYNYAFAQAMKNAITGDASNYSVDYSKLVFAEGNVKPAREVTLSKSAANTATIAWNISNITTLSSGGAKGNETASVVLYNEELAEAMLVPNTVERSVGSAELVCPDYWATNTVHAWMYFTRSDGKQNSNSEYVGNLKL